MRGLSASAVAILAAKAAARRLSLKRHAPERRFSGSCRAAALAAGRREAVCGFTLVEVLVALTLGALVVLLAYRTFAVASDLGEHIAERREAHDRAMNARRFLAQALGSLEVGTVRNTGFRGVEDEVAFTTWLPDETGASVRKQVTVKLDGQTDRRADGQLIALVRTLAGGSSNMPDTLRLVPGVSAVALDYLLDFGADAAWVREWHSPVSAPLAVRLRIARVEPEGVVDTLLLAIGPRG